jgi:hypothetical protein
VCHFAHYDPRAGPELAVGQSQPPFGSTATSLERDTEVRAAVGNSMTSCSAWFVCRRSSRAKVQLPAMQTVQDRGDLAGDGDHGHVARSELGNVGTDPLRGLDL